MDAFTVQGPTTYNCLRNDSASRCWSIACRGLLCLSLAIVCQAAQAQAMYRIKRLAFPGGCPAAPVAWGLNNAGQVTGGACNAQGQEHAFMRQPRGRMLDLGPSEAGSTSEGQAVSPNGQVAGIASDSTGKFSFLWIGAGKPLKRIYGGLGGTYVEIRGVNNNGQFVGSATLPRENGQHAFVWMNDGKPMVDLGTFGGLNSETVGITVTGLVAGNADLAGETRSHAFVWKNDGALIRDLGTLGGDFSNAIGMNASGQVVGASNTAVGGKPHAFLWRNDGTPMQDLGLLNGDFSYALAINDLGQVTGQVNLRAGGNATHAFVWMNDGKPMRDIGSIGGESTSPHSINSSGQVVGEGNTPGEAGEGPIHVFLWRNDGTRMQDVNNLIDPLDPLKPYVILGQALVINDHGNILAFGTDSRTGQYSTYLLKGTVLLLSPRALTFGDQPINTASVAKSVTVTNTSPNARTIASIALKGAASGQFAYGDDCGTSLAGHATCTINVTFRPTTRGAESAILNVNGGGGGLRSVTLTGNGT